MTASARRRPAHAKRLQQRQGKPWTRSCGLCCLALLAVVYPWFLWRWSAAPMLQQVDVAAGLEPPPRAFSGNDEPASQRRVPSSGNDARGGALGGVPGPPGAVAQVPGAQDTGGGWDAPALRATVRQWGSVAAAAPAAAPAAAAPAAAAPAAAAPAAAAPATVDDGVWGPEPPDDGDGAGAGAGTTGAAGAAPMQPYSGPNRKKALVFTMDSIDKYVNAASKGGPAGEIVVRRRYAVIAAGANVLFPL